MVYTRAVVYTTLLIACFSVAAMPQGPTGGLIITDSATLKRGEFQFGPLEVRTEKLESKLMGREMPFRVILPAGYADAANSTKRYPVIYLLHGLTGNFANWTERTDITEAARWTDAIIVTPEGENGWYTDSVTKPEDRHESYIVKELIPDIDKRYRTKAERKSRAIAGLSMGGYGALKFGLKYPEMFSLAGSFSGALGAATFPALGRSDASLN